MVTQKRLFYIQSVFLANVGRLLAVGAANVYNTILHPSEIGGVSHSHRGDDDVAETMMSSSL